MAVPTLSAALCGCLHFSGLGVLASSLHVVPHHAACPQMLACIFCHSSFKPYVSHLLLQADVVDISCGMVLPCSAGAAAAVDAVPPCSCACL